MRRLITLISAGRNRTIVIRRELPRTKGAGWVRRPDRIEDRRILLSVPPRPVTCSASVIGWLKPPLINLSGPVGPSWIVACSQDMPNPFPRHLVRLRLRRQIDYLERTLGPHTSDYVGRGTPASGIAIQHEDHAREPLQQLVLLRLRERRSHQCDHRTNAGLVQMEAVEEAFDHNHHPFGRDGSAVKIEQDLRFGKARRKAIARRGTIQ